MLKDMFPLEEDKTDQVLWGMISIYLQDYIIQAGKQR